MGTLYVVGTPIGNLEDITLRALRVLKEVDVVVCEDTRITKRLLDRYEITNKQLITYNERRSGVSIQKIIQFLKVGKNTALVSDAGTPGVSDPGSQLVLLVREAGFDVVAIPGPNAAIAALSVSGLTASDFIFLGFLPHKKGREKLFKEITELKRTVVFYESPHRLFKTLTALSRHLSKERRVVIIKELTKIYEEVVSGSIEHARGYFERQPEKVKGEFVIVVSSVV